MVSHLFPVALARGKHLFPFRTEKLSPSAPMVLGSQGPGRVGRRRFLRHTREPPTRAARGRSLRSRYAASRPPRPGGPMAPFRCDVRRLRPLSVDRHAHNAGRHPRTALRIALAPNVALATLPKRGQRTQTHLLARRRGPRTPCTHTAPQGHTMRMIAAVQILAKGPARTARRPLRPLVLADLPVDVIVILEQQE